LIHCAQRERGCPRKDWRAGLWRQRGGALLPWG